MIVLNEMRFILTDLINIEVNTIDKHECKADLNNHKIIIGI